MKSDESQSTSALTHIPAPLLLKFVHHVIDEMCGGIAVSHANYKEALLDAFWISTQTVKSLAQSVAVGKTTKDEAVVLLKPLDKEPAQEIYEAVLSRREEVKESLLRELVSSVHHLKDFDWNVRLAVASDKVLDLNEAYVNLQLHTSTSDIDEDTKSICVEMTSGQVDKLLEQLKEVQNTITKFQCS